MPTPTAARPRASSSSPDAAVLEAVGHRHRHLGRPGLIGEGHEPGDPGRLPAYLGDQRDMPAAVHLDQEPDQCLGQLGQRLQEPPLSRLGRESVEELGHQGPFLTAQRPYPNFLAHGIVSLLGTGRGPQGRPGACRWAAAVLAGTCHGR